MTKQNSQTQIVATLGPSSADPKIIEELIDHNMDVVRLNFSWGTHEEHKKFIETVREIANKKGKKIPIIADLSGPREIGKAGHKYSGSGSEIITEKDKKDLEFVLSMDVEYVAMSFVGSANDVLALKELIKTLNGKAKVIAKIERKIAVFNIEEIADVADAIMVARGDLGNEIPIESMPFVQGDLVDISNMKGKPVIVATEMMPSMMHEDDPSRSDVTDVAIAVLENADAVMLSDETAVGEYPVEVVKMMEKIVIESEKHDLNRSHNPL